MTTDILLATDFSEAAESAYAHAAQLALATGKSIRLVHVIDPTPYVGPYSWAMPPSNWFGEVVAAARKRLQDTAHWLGGDIEVTPRLLTQGPTVKALLRELEDHCFAAVIGTHGHRGVRKLLLGSVASKIVRASPVHVLLVPPTAKAGPVKRVLVPTDFSELDTGAFPDVMWICRAYGAEAELFHAWQPLIPTPFPGSLQEQKLRAADAAEREHRTEQTLADLIDYARGWDVAATSRAAEWERPADAVCQRAETGEFDMICMPSRGHSGLMRMLLGSVTEAVMTRASCPVMVVKPDGLASEVSRIEGIV